MKPSFNLLAPRAKMLPVVLYVEDQPVNVLLMQSLFERLGCAELLVAHSGAECLRLVRSWQPTLLLLDIGLPDCTGIELLEALRRLPGGAETPAVAVTAEPAFDIQGTGFAEMWEKPLDLPRVLSRLRQLLERPGPHPDLPPASLVQRRRWEQRPRA
jgi:CheY-like chemotaxis protein